MEILDLTMFDRFSGHASMGLCGADQRHRSGRRHNRYLKGSARDGST
jgi:hypothetical protein